MCLAVAVRPKRCPVVLVFPSLLAGLGPATGHGPPKPVLGLSSSPCLCALALPALYIIGVFVCVCVDYCGLFELVHPKLGPTLVTYTLIFYFVLTMPIYEHKRAGNMYYTRFGTEACSNPGGYSRRFGGTNWLRNHENPCMQHNAKW